VRRALRPEQQLLAVIRVGIGSSDRDIARFEFGGQVGEDAHLQVFEDQHELAVLPGYNQPPPLLGDEGQIEGRGQLLGLLFAQSFEFVECGDQAGLLTGRCELQRVEHPKQ